MDWLALKGEETGFIPAYRGKYPDQKPVLSPCFGISRQRMFVSDPLTEALFNHYLILIRISVKTD
jgi:hypothetical protein